MKRIKERPFEISSRLPQSQRELFDIRKQRASMQLTDDLTAPGRVAERISLHAEQSRLLSEAEMLKETLACVSSDSDALYSVLVGW